MKKFSKKVGLIGKKFSKKVGLIGNMHILFFFFNSKRIFSRGNIEFGERRSPPCMGQLPKANENGASIFG